MCKVLRKLIESAKTLVQHYMPTGTSRPSLKVDREHAKSPPLVAPCAWAPTICTEPRRDAWSRRRVPSSAASDGPADGASAEPLRARARAVSRPRRGRILASAWTTQQCSSTRRTRRWRRGASRPCIRGRRCANFSGAAERGVGSQGWPRGPHEARKLQVRRRVGAPVARGARVLRLCHSGGRPRCRSMRCRASRA